MTGRTNGVATYRNTDFFGMVDGLNFALQYQGKNNDTTAKNQTATVSVSPLTTTSTASVSLAPTATPIVLMSKLRTSGAKQLKSGTWRLNTMQIICMHQSCMANPVT